AAAPDRRCYFGIDLTAPPSRWPRAKRLAWFSDDVVLDAIQTAEVALNPVHLAALIREFIAANRQIETRLGWNVVGASDEGDRIPGSAEAGGVRQHERFDHVVNALWDGRLTLDRTIGLSSGRPWMHRLKYGVSLRLGVHLKPPPSATVVLGPFGEIVSYG